MSKAPFIIFGLFAAIFVLVIPFVALSKEGAGSAAPVEVPSKDEDAKDLFATNCGPCHTLLAAGADGVVGPDLDEFLGVTPDVDANADRVLSAVEDGRSGRMPAGILSGPQAEEVAEFVARYVRYTSEPKKGE